MSARNLVSDSGASPPARPVGSPCSRFRLSSTHSSADRHPSPARRRAPFSLPARSASPRSPAPPEPFLGHGHRHRSPSRNRPPVGRDRRHHVSCGTSDPRRNSRPGLDHLRSGLASGRAASATASASACFSFSTLPANWDSPVASPPLMGRFTIDPLGRVLLSAQHLSAFQADPVLGGKSRVSFSDFALAVQRAGEEE